jgi:hypothetical protein
MATLYGSSLHSTQVHPSYSNGFIAECFMFLQFSSLFDPEDLNIPSLSNFPFPLPVKGALVICPRCVCFPFELSSLHPTPAQC